MKIFSCNKTKPGATQGTVAPNTSAPAPTNPSKSAHPRFNLKNFQREFDFITSAIKRFGLWSLVWGQGMALWFYHIVGILPHNIADFALISVECIAIMTVFTASILFFALLPFFYGGLIFIGYTIGKLWILIYVIFTIIYSIILWYIINITNPNYAIYSAIIIAAINLILFFIPKNNFSPRLMLYAPFMVPPILFILFIRVPILQKNTMTFIGEMANPKELLISKNYNIIPRYRHLYCNLNHISSPYPSLYYAFPGTTTIAMHNGDDKVIIPGIYNHKKCKASFIIPNKYLVEYYMHHQPVNRNKRLILDNKKVHANNRQKNVTLNK